MTQFPATSAHASLTQMSLAHKIGQTLIIGFEGLDVSPPLREMIERHHVGGVILFARNIASPQQVARLTSELQAIARASGHPGLFVAIDQEGGRVARLTEATGFTHLPSAMALAATGDVANATRAAHLLAAELRAVGINVNFAPVLDVNNNPANPVIGTRSFSSDPAVVARYGLAFIDALQAAGVLAFGKHFPGHGDTAIDSHVGLPQIAHDRTRLDQIELAPFRAAIAAHVAGIMSAHVTFPAIASGDQPATLSAAVLTDLLRGELGFNGLIVTDSLEMLALRAAGYDPPHAAAAALAAGADVLLFNAGFADHKAAIARITNQIAAGTMPQARLDQAVARILAAKTRFNLIEPASLDPAQLAHVGAAERRAAADQIAAQSITVLRNDAGLLPLDPAHAVVIDTTAGARLAQALDLRYVPLDELQSLTDDRSHAKGQVPTMIIGIKSSDELTQMPADLIGPQSIVIALRDPYDLLHAPQAATLVATYSAAPPVLRALRHVLGGTSLQGRLPVDLPGMFERGSGLPTLTERV